MPLARFRRPAPRPALLLVTLALLAAAAAPAAGGAPTAVSARAELALAEDAARSWAPDARLVYVENDADLDSTGAAPRWGYLFHSEAKGLCRAYSLAGGRVRQARDLEFDFAAPPLAADWLDSDAARAAGDAAGGRDYCREHGGRLSSLLLLRGVLHLERPDLSTWALVYSSPDAPSLYVLLDATTGKRVRTWRG